jgi:hypothetical protein
MRCLPQVGNSGRELPVLERDSAWSEYQESSRD